MQIHWQTPSTDCLVLINTVTVMTACQASETATAHQIQSNSACETYDTGGKPGLRTPVLTEGDDRKQLCVV